MDGFRHLAHEAAGLPPCNLDPDTWPSLLSFNNSLQPEPPLQEFGIVSWPDATFSSWGLSTIPQSLLKTCPGEELLTKPMPLLPTSISSTRSRPPPTRPPSASSTTPTATFAAPEPKQPQAFLRLLHIPHTAHNHSLHINPHNLSRLFHVLDLDPHALYLFHTYTPGFHVLSSGPSASSSQKLSAPLDGTVLRFYLSSNDVTTIWSYNASTRTTLGVCLVDARMGHKFLVVKYHLEAFRGVLASPGVVVCADVARACVWRGEGEIASMEGGYDGLGGGGGGQNNWGKEEEGSGWRASDKIYTDSMELSPVLMETLSRRCRVLGRVITKAQEAKSALGLSLRMARQLTSRKLWRKLDLTCPARAFDPITEEANAQIRLVIRELIIPQLKARVFGWTCRQKEAVVWTNVLMARISRTDASTNHREASSMRVIAVMTMAFLPATFFATLFALPAFQWEVIDGYNNNNPPGRGVGTGGRDGGGRGGGDDDDDGVIQKSFWIWVAFSVPMTMLVFVVCGVTSSSWWSEGRKEWWRRLRPRRRR
ncbi:hypothetical protein QBC32DRAFT_323897 [Pseudoneurospora amorphoporcata]|uniref:Uncharacterized protein n=1 Tax=Pseudoneurospora amorphoporcata TaxID=241081 RepID=A0AAN6SGW2_9PEZI|nr:hypothetical protein QBC32DRAFT_323897 [Pseudoneurospora amorphoporcata]